MADFQYGVLVEAFHEGEESFALYDFPVHGLDTALNTYHSLKKTYPDRPFRLVKIIYEDMKVIDPVCL